MASGVRDFSVTIVAAIVALITGVGAQSCLSWILEPEGVGSYVVVILFEAVLSWVCLVTGDVGGRYLVAAKKLTLSEGMINTFILMTGGSLLAIVAGLIILQLPLSFVSKASPLAFYIALAGVPLMAIAGLSINMMIAISEFGWRAVIQICAAFAHLVLTLLFVWYLGWGVEGALLAVFTPYLLTIIAVLIFFRGKHGLHWVRPRLKTLYEIFHYGLRYYVFKISNRVNIKVGSIVLALFATKPEIAFFSRAISVVSRVEMIPNTLASVLMPRVAGHKKGRPELVAQSARLSGLVCGAALLILAVFAKPIVALVFSPKFLPMVPLIQIMAFGVTIRCACKIFLPYILSKNHPGIASLAVAAGMGVNLLLLWLLLPVLGLTGAAISVLVSYLVGSAILSVSFQRFSALGVGQLWRYQRDDWVLLRDAFGQMYYKFVSKKTD